MIEWGKQRLRRAPRRVETYADLLVYEPFYFPLPPPLFLSLHLVSPLPLVWRLFLWGEPQQTPGSMLYFTGGSMLYSMVVGWYIVPLQGYGMWNKWYITAQQKIVLWLRLIKAYGSILKWKPSKFWPDRRLCMQDYAHKVENSNFLFLMSSKSTRV